MRTSASQSLITVATVLIGALAGTSAFAQTPDPQGPPGPPDSAVAVATRDIVDVLRELRH